MKLIVGQALIFTVSFFAGLALFTGEWRFLIGSVVGLTLLWKAA